MFIITPLLFPKLSIHPPFYSLQGKHFTHWVNMKQNLSNTNVTFSLSVFQLPLSATFFLHRNALHQEKQGLTIVKFCALFLLYYVNTITYVRCAYSSWSMYIQKHTIVDENYGNESVPLKRRENGLRSPIYFLSIMLKCMH